MLPVERGAHAREVWDSAAEAGHIDGDDPKIAAVPGNCRRDFKPRSVALPEPPSEAQLLVAERDRRNADRRAACCELQDNRLLRDLRRERTQRDERVALPGPEQVRSIFASRELVPRLGRGLARHRVDQVQAEVGACTEARELAVRDPR